MILDQMANKEYLFDKVKRAFKTHNEKTKKTSELVFLTFWVGLFSDIAFESSWFIFLPVLSLEEDKDQQEVK